MNPTFSAQTNGVMVDVRPRYLADQSEPDDNSYQWAYTVSITNARTTTIQLLRRRWLITNSHAKTICVEGTGVVGEQPILDPGDTFEYTSGTPLDTPSGFMRGAYTVQDLSTGDVFEVQIPAFSLDGPASSSALH